MTSIIAAVLQHREYPIPAIGRVHRAMTPSDRQEDAEASAKPPTPQQLAVQARREAMVSAVAAGLSTRFGLQRRFKISHATAKADVTDLVKQGRLVRYDGGQGGPDPARYRVSP